MKKEIDKQETSEKDINIELKGGEENQMVKVTCKHCGYTWESSSEKMFVSCPSCLQKTPTKVNQSSVIIENGKQ